MFVDTNMKKIFGKKSFQHNPALLNSTENEIKLKKIQLTSIKEGIITSSLYLLSSKSHSQLDELFT
jgi:hypothetical protein